MENYSLLKKIDGKIFEEIILSGGKNLKANLKIVNDLNVFPIPDGDTGDNMYATYSGGFLGLKETKENSVCKKADALSSGMLMSARGNSGVILSQLFAGVAEGAKDKEEITVKEFATALQQGVVKAYSSVSEPVEGTVLTVARESVDYAYSKITEETTLGEFFEYYILEMRASLDRTPELLPTLKEAGVIDSGGAGLLYIAEGMKMAVLGEEISLSEEIAVTSSNIDLSKFNENSVMKFGYCTELLLQLQTVKTDVMNFPLEELKSYMQSIGDSVVTFQTGTVVKINVHTMTPYKVLEYCQKFGEFLTVKIENMTLQHNGLESDDPVKKERKKERPRTKFAVVTVSSGKGWEETLLEMGASLVIDGGQCKNPSIERFIEAFDEVNADNIFVLPNNSNIIMTASEAGKAYKKSLVKVIPTKSVGDAYACLSALDYSSENVEEIASQMIDDMQGVTTGMVTKAVRDAKLGGVKIKEGQYIGYTNKTMLTSKDESIVALFDLLAKMDTLNKNFLIIAYGESVTDSQKREVERLAGDIYKGLEIYPIDGGQEVYDFIVIVE